MADKTVWFITGAGLSSPRSTQSGVTCSGGVPRAVDCVSGGPHG